MRDDFAGNETVIYAPRKLFVFTINNPFFFSKRRDHVTNFDHHEPFMEEDVALDPPFNEDANEADT